MCYVSSIARACAYDLQLSLVWAGPLRQRFSITQFCLEVNSVMLSFLTVGLVLFFEDRDRKTTEKCLYLPCLIISLQWSCCVTKSGKGLYVVLAQLISLWDTSCSL